MKKIMCISLFVGILFTLTACNFEVSYKLPNEEEVIINNATTKADFLEDFEKDAIKLKEPRPVEEKVIVDGVIMGKESAEKIEDINKGVITDTSDVKLGSPWLLDTTEDAPANWDEFVLVDERNYNTDTVETLGVKLLAIYRNAEAERLVKEYTDFSTFYDYTEPEVGYNWEVFKLGVDFSNYTITYTNGLVPDFTNFKLITVGESSLFTDEGFHILTEHTITVAPERIYSDDIDKYREILIAVSVPENLVNPVIQLGTFYSPDNSIMRLGYISYTAG